MKGLSSWGTSAGGWIFGSCNGCSEGAIGWKIDGTGTGNVGRQKAAPVLFSSRVSSNIPSTVWSLAQAGFLYASMSFFSFLR